MQTLDMCLLFKSDLIDVRPLIESAAASNYMISFLCRFVQSSDHSLAITRTNEADSGTYTCMAETDLDFDEATASLR